MRPAGTAPVTTVRALERVLGLSGQPEDLRHKLVQEWVDEQCDRGVKLPERLILSLEVSGYRVPQAA